ncbi:MAG: serine/threonine-protein kinase [Myxococcota bacterium]
MEAAAAPPTLPEPGALVADKYVIDRLIGRGGMGAVYSVTHQLTRKPFALKWMVPQLAGDKEAMGRFVREAQATCAIDHPNVVEVFDVGTSGEAMYLVMELLTGEPLSARIERGPMQPKELIELLGPAMHGLAQAHATGIVHRDLKPENIFVCEARPGMPEMAKVLDFGISKVGGPQDMRLTATNTAMGTPYYMAPEQLRDASNVDARADIYAMGCVLYEALSGRQPIDADSFAHLVIKVATEDPEPILQVRPDIPPAFGKVVDRCLAKDPADRPQSMDELMTEMSRALGWDHERWVKTGVGSRMRIISKPPPPMPRPVEHDEDPPTLPSSGRGGVIALVVVLLLAVVGGIVAMSGGDDEDAVPPPAAVVTPEPLPEPAAPVGEAAAPAPEPAPVAGATPPEVEPEAVDPPPSSARARPRPAPRATMDPAPATPMAAAPVEPPHRVAPRMAAPRMSAGTRVDWDQL